MLEQISAEAAVTLDTPALAVASPKHATKRRKLLDRILPLGPLGLTAYIMACSLAILTCFRAILTGMHIQRFSGTPEFWWLFVVGLRMDMILLSFATILPTLFLMLLPKRLIGKIRPVLALWFTGFMCLLVYMEIATIPFVDEYDLRPDQKFLEYLKHVREVVTTLVKVYSFELAIGGVALVSFAVLFWSSTNYILREYREWSAKSRLLLLPIVIGLLVLGARSTLGHRPANISSAYFSENHLANEFALNSTYSMLYAGYRMFVHEKNPSLDYGKMPREEILARVRARSLLPAQDLDAEIPFLHVQKSPFVLERPMNVVVFLQESMGAVDVGCLKGPPITPNLCRLKEEGIWFSNLYATGTRTVRGIEATVSGFLPTSAVGVVKLPKAKNGFFSGGSLFARYGYGTVFLYGGMSNFDEMRSFFMGNGFKKIYDEPTFENPVFHGTWGVSDEDLVRKANQVFAAHGDQPFFATILSTSNHTPYEFPEGRIELYEQPPNTHFNAIKYADYAIGLFFELARKESYYKNTLFLVVADHNSHVRGNEHVPLSKFHVPALLIGPNVPKLHYDKLASQIDLLPTILHFSGLETSHPMIGRNLMTLPPEVPGRAFMQYASNNAYQVGDQVVIHRPYLPPDQYSYREEKLTHSELDPELAKDALAHAHLPWLLYSERRYRLPN